VSDEHAVSSIEKTCGIYQIIRVISQEFTHRSVEPVEEIVDAEDHEDDENTKEYQDKPVVRTQILEGGLTSERTMEVADQVVEVKTSRTD
jgi:hypothetical protein